MMLRQTSKKFASAFASAFSHANVILADKMPNSGHQQLSIVLSKIVNEIVDSSRDS